jgi:hypothetical protein
MMLTEPVKCSTCGCVSVNGGTIHCHGCFAELETEATHFRAYRGTEEKKLRKRIYELEAAIAAIKTLCEQDREDMGIEAFQNEILAAMQEAK